MTKSPEAARYITLHGPDGSGKTTVGRALAGYLEENGASAVYFPDWRKQNDIENPFYEPLRTEEAKQPRLLLSLVLAKLAYDSWYINELLGTGTHVIKDRGLWDVRADMAWRDMDPELCDSPAIKKPDFSAYLNVGEDARRRYLDIKEDRNANDYESNDPGTRLHSLTQYVLGKVVELEKQGRGMVIAADSLTIRDLAEGIGDTILTIDKH